MYVIQTTLILNYLAVAVKERSSWASSILLWASRSYQRFYQGSTHVDFMLERVRPVTPCQTVVESLALVFMVFHTVGILGGPVCSFSTE